MSERPLLAVARKDLTLMVRDRRSLVLLLAMPAFFISVLGALLGEGFGAKADDRVRVSIVDLDRGKGILDASFAKLVRDDLLETPGIRVEVLPDRETAQRLVARHERAAVIVLGADFSDRLNGCSFLPDGINPFHREGIHLDRVGVEVIRDPRQIATASLVEQVGQVSLLRVVLPYMIGKAFERLSDPDFIEILARNVVLPVPPVFRAVFPGGKVNLSELLRLGAGGNAQLERQYRARAGEGVQGAISEQFARYDLMGKTWAALTRSKAQGTATEVEFTDTSGKGWLNRGAARYQILVPAQSVLFAFLIVLLTGSILVTERSSGTLTRLRLSPLGPGGLAAGKFLPVLAVSLLQNILLFVAGWAVFGMRFGPESWSAQARLAALAPLLACVSVAAAGLAVLVAALARGEMQVALLGALPALVGAVLGGCVLPRELFPESTRWLAFLTPHGWALNAYLELLDPDPMGIPDMNQVAVSCGVLGSVGMASLAGAWFSLAREWRR